MNKPVILASKSPRRKELLEKCISGFTCIPADIDETINEDNDLSLEIKRLSRRKAEHVLASHPNAIVIGSDTIVVVDGKILGKPHDDNEAFAMVKLLQGRTHQVITGLCVISSERTYEDASVSEVTFAPMSDEEIAAYVATGECADKAGAYGIQGYGGKYITHISGDFYAIMGLPLNLVYEELKRIL